MIKAVIFDLDNTLYDYSLCHKKAMEELAQAGAKLFGVSEDEFINYYEAAKTEVKKNNYGVAAEHNRMFYGQKTAELMGKSPIPVALDLYNAYWDAFLAVVQPYTGALEFLRELKQNGILTAICTDMTAHIQYRKLIRLGMDSLIDYIVSSEEAGVEKPHPLMFQLVLDKLKVNTAEAVYFGDSYERDVEGAINSGIRPVWFVADRSYEPRNNVVICSDYADTDIREICGIRK